MNSHLTVFVFFTLLWTSSAYAYLDPGTGSIIIQSAIAAVVAGLYTVKTYWFSIRSFFASLFGKKGLKHGEENNNDAE